MKSGTKKSTRSFVVPNFYSKGRSLRHHFEEIFGQDRSTNDRRFLWDYWHVPGQYTCLRTPANFLFPEPILNPFLKHLQNWGREHLGIEEVSMPWVSCYVDGCYQNLHADLPHGPWSFVYSLTPKPKFTGGETWLATESLLDYWNSGFQGLEASDVHELIPPRFNQLTVFDPRIPHGVQKVHGVHRVQDARLVIHGWFTNPKPIFQGPVRPIDPLIEHIQSQFPVEGDLLSGTISLRFKVLADGQCQQVAFLASSLRWDGQLGSPNLNTIRAYLRKAIESFRFKAVKEQTLVILPLTFQT